MIFMKNTKTKETLFGQNLRLLRKQKGYTLDQLADLSGISKRMISHYETQVKRPSIEKITTLAKVLNVPMNELMDISDDPRNLKEDKTFYKIMKKVRLIEKLSEREQRAIFQYINTIVEKNNLKKELKTKKKKP